MSVSAQTTRDPLKQPFASSSIWNMPIGRNAVYVPANLPAIPYNANEWAPMPMIDQDIIVLTPNAPITNLNYSSAAWTGANRCAATGGVLFQVPMPSDYIVPNGPGNASAVFLQKDGRTLIHTQPLARCTAGGAGTTLTPPSDFPPVDLYGDGIRGSHGGSGLSAIGGAIRLGELRPGSQGPAHALKVAFYSPLVLYNCSTASECFRWPADRADSGAVSSYGTLRANSSAMKMGALLAIPTFTNISTMGLETEPAKQLAWTLQNYGAYIDDTQPGPAFVINAEIGPNGSFLTQFQNDWGFPVEQRVNSNSPWSRDIQRLMIALYVVDNNSPTSIGGGGTPLQPLAAPLAGTTSDTTAPSTPAGLSASAISASQINLSWAASTDNVGVTGYRVYRSGTLITTVGAVTSYQNTGLTAGTSYAYTVQAIDAAGNASGQSTAASAKTLTGGTGDTIAPSVPTGLVGTAASSTQINLSWNASTDNVGVTGYYVYLNEAILAATTSTTFQHKGLISGTTYNYRVSAFDAVPNHSAWTPAVSVKAAAASDTAAPSVPGGLSATAASASQINLSWAASTDNIGVTGYRVYRAGALIATVGSVTNYQNTGLAAATSYAYTVRAIDAAGNASGQSASASATTKAAVDTTSPSVPTGLGATAVSSSQINLSWAASTDNVGVTGYRVYRANALVATVGAVTSYQNTGLIASTSYAYTVQAIDAAGNASGQSSVASATTQSAQPITDTIAPSVPTGLTASAVSGTQVKLTWQPSTDNVGVKGYIVYLNNAQLATITTGTSFQHTGLTPGATYSYRVSAFDAKPNHSAWTAVPVSVKTPIQTGLSPDGTKITAPTGSLVTTAGTWTFGSATATGGNAILLNGQLAAGGYGTNLYVLNQGKVYTFTMSSRWYLWSGSGWSQVTAPI